MILGVAGSLSSSAATREKQKVADLKYGAVLYEFYQQNYFEALVEFEYAKERGGIRNHGNYPELLKGGVSLSYGIDQQAKEIFLKIIAENTTQEVKNRAWFYLSKMLYLRGDIANAASSLNNISGVTPYDIDQEYRYLAALVNIKLGKFDEAESISRSFNDDSAYAPYLYFNLGVALGKQGHFSRAIENLLRSTDFADGSESLDRVSDRAHLAIAYLFGEQRKFTKAYAEIKSVSVNGVYSNRALLGSGWVSLNSKAYSNALAPLTILEKRSTAIPEVQEAILLVPHVYEKLGLMGRAAQGFITAYSRYGNVLSELVTARETLKDTDVLTLFVRNLDDMIGESDWFGLAPNISLNALSPFLLDLMSDHSFQSILKELRDLYAIRNNLNRWKQNDFNVILKDRARSIDIKESTSLIRTYAAQQSEYETQFSELENRVSTLGRDDQKRVIWILEGIDDDLNASKLMLSQLNRPSQKLTPFAGYVEAVDQNMLRLDEELAKTEKLIEKVEKVMIKLVNAELDIHEERIKYYRVQSHLARVRILDRSLNELDKSEEKEFNNDQENSAPSLPLKERYIKASGEKDAS